MANSVDSPTPRICLVVLIGLPGSGKTTFSRHIQTFLKEHENMSKFGVFHVCYDQLVPLSKQKEMAMAASSEKETKSLESDSEVEQNFKICRKNITLMADKIICKLKGSEEDLETTSDNILPPVPKDVEAKENILLVIDDNNYYQSMRHEYYQLARKHTVGFCQIYLKPNGIDTLLSNNHKRSEDERIPDEVIKKMDSKIEPPNPFENSWEQFSFSINVGEATGNQADQNLFNMETCLDVVNAALDNPVQPLPPTPPDKTEESKAKSRNICSTNVYHIADKILRKLLNTQMREAMKNEESDMTQLGQRLNKARTKLLQDLKTSVHDCIPSEVISAVTDEQDIGQENMIKANQDLEKIVGDLFEVKLKTV